MMKKTVMDYIRGNWDSCVKYTPEDSETGAMGLPYPYVVPAVGCFDVLFYWDTYFINKGLEVADRFELVKNNTDNMLYLVRKYGFMPNGSHRCFLLGSQPPFLSLMVRDVYDHFGDKEWLSRAYEALQIEYTFWQEKRTSPIGLNCYFGENSPETAEGNIAYWEDRVGIKFTGSLFDKEHHCRATGESGWDATPRFEYDAHHFAPADLNSLMYMFEVNMAYFAEELGLDSVATWQQAAALRKERMYKYLLTEDGLFLDYNYATGKHSPVFSVASYFPLFAGLADQARAEAAQKNLNRLEEAFGVSTCEQSDIPGVYQWGYPNGWACLQYITVCGLNACGYTDDAKRLAHKFMSVVEKVFAETDNLWEKYNVVEGSINVTNEYDMPPMMGWTAGVYSYFDRYFQ